MDNERLNQVIDNIPMYKIVSSNISFIGYSEEYKILKVIFTTGATYIYFGVPEVIWKELLNTESKGKFLNESVIKRKDLYQFIKL